MTRTRMFTISVGILGLACGLGLGTAIGQQSPPTEIKGVSVGKTAAMDLGSELQGMQGRQLRVRVITVEPGGQIRNHSHQDWPEVVYVSQGAVTEYRGSQSSDYRTGDTFQAGKDTTHWLENKGTAPVVILWRISSSSGSAVRQGTQTPGNGGRRMPKRMRSVPRLRLEDFDPCPAEPTREAPPSARSRRPPAAGRRTGRLVGQLKRRLCRLQVGPRSDGAPRAGGARRGDDRESQHPAHLVARHLH